MANNAVTGPETVEKCAGLREHFKRPNKKRTAITGCVVKDMMVNRFYRRFSPVIECSKAPQNMLPRHSTRRGQGCTHWTTKSRR